MVRDKRCFSGIGRLDFRSLEVFVWVATLGSFRGAAARLNTTQPAVSQRIAQLEADLGVRLLDRSRSGVSVTSRGRVLLAGAERLLGQVAALRAEVGEAGALGGSLRLGTAETLVHTWLPVFLRRVATTYPRLAIEVEVDVTPSLSERLRAHELDLAFLLGPVAGLENRPLQTLPLAFLASPALGLGEGRLGREVLAGHALITFSRRTEPYGRLAAAVAGLVPPARIHASASLATVVRMTLDGLGIAVVPEAIASAELRDGRLQRLDVAVQLPTLGFTATWRTSPAAYLPGALAELAVEVASS